MSKIGSLLRSGKIIESRENPYYLSLTDFQKILALSIFNILFQFYSWEDILMVRLCGLILVRIASLLKSGKNNEIREKVPTTLSLRLHPDHGL